jgi:hypothetical protein
MTTLPELARQLEPIADAALDSSNPDVLAVATILAAIMGCIAEGPMDHEALRPLVLTAGAICEHRSGLHGRTPGCDCDQPNNPDVRYHASDCEWRKATEKKP